MYSIKIAVIGCGYWGQNLVRVFAELGVLKYIFDMDQAVAKDISKKYSVPALSFAEILKTDIEGVVIAAPAALHYTLAKQALMAKKHVFVEKPLSLKVEDAKELCDLAVKQQSILMVGHLLQYHPCFLRLKQIITAGDLGKLQYIYSNRLNLGKFRSEENILWSFAPHDISMILNIVNDVPEQVYATGSCYLNSAIQDVTITHLSFKNGIKAHIFVSWLHPYKEQKLVIVGDRGMAVFDDSLSWNEKLQLYPHQVNWVNGLPHAAKALAVNIPVEAAEPLKLECQHFVDCIKNNNRPRTDGLEGLQVLRVLDMAQQSLGSLMPRSLKQELNNYFKHDTAIVDSGSKIGEGTKIWHFSHILNNVVIGKNCILGQNVMIGPDVVVGNNCKIQNNVSIYKGVTLEDGVFCGPSCVFTNVNNPRAEIERKNEFDQTYVEKGVTIGANATIICGVKLGAYSFIGAGAVVTKNVKPHALMVGNPARQVGWVSHAGEVLKDDLVCPREGRIYKIKINNDAEKVLCLV